MNKPALLAAFAALLLLAALPAVAGEEGHEEEMGETALHGCLATGEEEGHYVLTEKGEGGEQVTVHGPDSFADHIGHEVKITGEWHEEDGEKVFHATGMEHISTDC